MSEERLLLREIVQAGELKEYHHTTPLVVLFLAATIPLSVTLIVSQFAHTVDYERSQN